MGALLAEGSEAGAENGAGRRRELCVQDRAERLSFSLEKVGEKRPDRSMNGGRYRVGKLPFVLPGRC